MLWKSVVERNLRDASPLERRRSMSAKGVLGQTKRQIDTVGQTRYPEVVKPIEY